MQYNYFNSLDSFRSRNKIHSWFLHSSIFLKLYQLSRFQLSSQKVKNSWAKITKKKNKPVLFVDEYDVHRLLLYVIYQLVWSLVHGYPTLSSCYELCNCSFCFQRCYALFDALIKILVEMGRTSQNIVDIGERNRTGIWTNKYIKTFILSANESFRDVLSFDQSNFDRNPHYDSLLHGQTRILRVCCWRFWMEIFDSGGLDVFINAHGVYLPASNHDWEGLLRHSKGTWRLRNSLWWGWCRFGAALSCFHKEKKESHWIRLRL